MNKLHYWIEVLQRYEEGERQPLIDMLLSNAKLTPTVRSFLADLLLRQPKRRGAKSKRAPIWLGPGKMFFLAMAIGDVRHLVRKGDKVAVAVSKVAASTKIDESVLASAYTGKHAGFRRATKAYPFLKFFCG